MIDLTAAEQAVLASIDNDEIVRDLAALVAVPSVDGSPHERDAQLWCADRLGALGMTVDCWEIDIDEERAQPGFPGMEVDRTSAVGCVGVLGPGDEQPALALYGHTDVVPPGDDTLWPAGGPFAMRVDDAGRAWGRGTCDMKAGLVAAIGAVAAIGRSGTQLASPLAVHCVSAEEDGGLGAVATLRRGHRAAGCISAEPTSGTIIPANAGALTFRLEITGLATHGSTRTRGISAIEVFEAVHKRLRDLEAARHHAVPELFAHLDLAWPLSIGKIAAGDWASTVPDRLVAEGRYGVRIDESVAEAQAAFEDAVARTVDDVPWLAEHPVLVSWPGGMFAPGRLANGHPLELQVADAVEAVRGTRPVSLGGPYGSDLRHYATAGIPTLQYGPGDVRHAHATDEHVDLADVFACARVYARLALRSCGVA